MNKIKLFEDKKIRYIWNEEEQQWYFSVVDVVRILTDSANPTDYLKKLRKRDVSLGSYLGTNCPQGCWQVKPHRDKTYRLSVLLTESRLKTRSTNGVVKKSG